MMICDRCLNNVCGKEHEVVIDTRCEGCGQIKDCLPCEHRLSMLCPYIPLITCGLGNDALRYHCKGHGKEEAPMNVRDHYQWLWHRRRRLRRIDDAAHQLEMEALQDEMDDIWYNMPKEDVEWIRANLGT